MNVSSVSPELALVDPELRAELLAALPPIEPYSFLQIRDVPSPAPVPIATKRARRRRPPLVLAAAAYFVSSAARVVVMDALFVLGLAGAVACVQLVA
jgi:hypothetical protein